MVERIKPTKSEKVASGPAALSEYSKPILCKVMGGCEISFRAKKTDYGQIRRYYVGLVQFGCIRRENDRGFIVHRTGQDDDPQGTRFPDEGGAEAFLFQQLVAK